MSSSDKKAVIAFLTLSQDELDLRAQRWISADTPSQLPNPKLRGF